MRLEKIKNNFNLTTSFLIIIKLKLMINNLFLKTNLMNNLKKLIIIKVMYKLIVYI
jgi:hypothetical protein